MVLYFGSENITTYAVQEAKEIIMAIQYIDRRHSDCSKWDGLREVFGEDDLQAMWVADMDFRCPDCVIEKIRKYTDFGVFGYYRPRDSYLEAFLDWEKLQHGYTVKKDWVRFAPGVVPAFNWLVQILTEPGDAVIVQTPVYYPFLNAVRNNGRELVCSDLVDTEGVYTIDFVDFEKKIAEHHVKLFILSSPHNPVSRVWNREELRTMLEICRRYGVFILSDEIHQDFVFAGNRHIPSALAGDYDDLLVTLTAATKTFNLAGCQNSFVVIPCKEIREKFDRFTENIQIRGGNPFGYLAVEAAYREGLPWLEEVRSAIYENYRYASKTLLEAFPKLVISPLEGTYLMWIDFGAYLRPEELMDFFQKRCRLAFDYGDWFGGKRFGTHVRMNLATSGEMIKEAVSRMIRALAEG